MRTITPCLWLDGKAEEAATFYTSLLPDSRIDEVQRVPANYPSRKPGNVLTVEFTLIEVKTGFAFLSTLRAVDAGLWLFVDHSV